MNRIYSTFFFLTVLLLAGCMQPAPAAGEDAIECTSVFVPPPQAGDRFEYVGEGKLYSPSFRPLWDPRSVFPNSSEEASGVSLDPGGRLFVSVGGATPRLAISGDLADAFPVVYEVQQPGGPRVLVSQEYLEAATSTLVQAVTVDWLVPNGGPDKAHSIRFGRDFQPPVMASAPFWGKTLDGSDVEAVIGSEVAFPAMESQMIPMTYTFLDYGERDGDCTASFRLTWEDVRYGYEGQSITMTFQDNTALPISYAFDPNHVQATPFEVHLNQTTQGQGPSLAAYSPPHSRSSSLAMQTVEDAFPAGSVSTFAHTFQEADQAIRSNLFLGEWFDEHPDALPVFVEHRNGEPGGKYVDGWFVDYVSPEGDVFRAQARFRAEPGLFPPDPEVSGEQVGESYPMPPATAMMVTLGEMEAAHSKAYGPDAEVLWCYLSLRRCSIGTHQGTGLPRIADGFSVGGSTTIRPGVIVDLDRGFVPQASSYDERGIDRDIL